MSKLVTIKQALILRDLGFKESTTRHAYRFDSTYYLQPGGITIKQNVPKHSAMLAMPTVDQAIDYIRRKYNIIIFDATEPFVDLNKNSIMYSYKVKLCNKKWGWNYRKYIGKSKWSADSYAMKRQALWIAFRYIIKENAKRRTNCKNR